MFEVADITMQATGRGVYQGGFFWMIQYDVSLLIS